jgi:hypothetical protein
MPCEVCTIDWEYTGSRLKDRSAGTTSQPVRRHLDFDRSPHRDDSSSGALGPRIAPAMMPIIGSWHHLCPIAQGSLTSESGPGTMLRAGAGMGAGQDRFFGLTSRPELPTDGRGARNWGGDFGLCSCA